jgi:hypothetical protein
VDRRPRVLLRLLPVPSRWKPPRVPLIRVRQERGGKREEGRSRPRPRAGHGAAPCRPSADRQPRALRPLPPLRARDAEETEELELGFGGAGLAVLFPRNGRPAVRCRSEEIDGQERPVAAGLILAQAGADHRPKRWPARQLLGLGPRRTRVDRPWAVFPTGPKERL